MPPTPPAATFTRSLGEMRRDLGYRPLGRMVKAAVVAAAVRRKSRRGRSGGVGSFGFMAAPALVRMRGILAKQTHGVCSTAGASPSPRFESRNRPTASNLGEGYPPAVEQTP